MKNNKIFSLLVISLFFSACDNSASDNKKNSAVETDPAPSEKVAILEDAAQEWIEQDNKIKSEVTSLADSADNVVEELKEKTMTNFKDKFKSEYSDWQQGRVQYFDLEGGFYGIITDSGQKLFPMNMAKKFADNGAIVRIKGQELKDVMTIRQWGTPFTIIDIELIKPGNKSINPEM